MISEESNNQKAASSSADPLKKKRRVTLCKVCGGALPRGVGRCVICGTARGDSTPLHATPPPSNEAQKHKNKPTTPSGFRRTRLFISRMAATMALVLIVSALSVGVFEYITYQSLLSRYNLEHSVLYQKGGNSLKLNLNTISKPIILTERFQSSSATLTAQESHDLRFLGYLNNQRSVDKGVAGNLFLLDMLALSPEYDLPSEGTKVTEQQVSDFRFLPKKDSLVYLTTSGELYLSEYRSLTSLLGNRSIHSTLLDNEVKGIGEIDDAQILYYKGASADTTSYETNTQTHAGNSFDLYTLGLEQRRERPVMIATNVYSVLDSTKNYEQVIYTKRTHNPPLVQYEVYLYNALSDQEDTLMASNVWHVVDANAEKNSLLYLTPLQDMVRYDDLFEDDMLEQDDINRMASSATTATPSDTTPLEEIKTVDEETDETGEVSESAEETEEVFEVDDSGEVPGVGTESPDTEITATEERQLRDKFRAHLKSSIRDEKQNSYLSFDLYEYNGATRENGRLAGPIYNWSTAEKLVHLETTADFAVFVESNPSQINKQKISDFTTGDLELFLQEPFELLSFLAEHMPDSLAHLSLSTRNVQKLFSEPGSRYISDVYVAPNATVNKADVYFISKSDFHSPTGTLYHAPFLSGVGDKIIHQDEDVEAIIGKTGGESASLVYQTASRDEPPLRNLYSTSNAGIGELAIDTSSSQYVQLIGDNQDFVVFFRSYNPIAKTGDLYVYRNGEESFITSDVSSVTSSQSDVFFLVRREPNSFRSLYEYRDGVLFLLDERLGGYKLFESKE